MTLFEVDSVKHIMTMKTIVLKSTLFFMLAFTISPQIWGQDVDSLKQKFEQYHHGVNTNIAIETGEKIISLQPDIITDSANVDFIFKLANYYYWKRDDDALNRAIELYNYAQIIYSTEGKNLEAAKMRIEIGKCQLALHEYDNAALTFSHVEQMCKDVLGEFTQEYANILDEIGYKYLFTYFEDEDKGYDKSVYYFSIAKDVYATIKGYNSPEVAERLRRMAESYKMIHDYNRAIECYNDIKDIYINLTGKYSLEVAEKYEILAEAYIIKGDYNKAIECYNSIKDIYTELTNGKYSSEVVESLITIASIYTENNEYNNALEYYKKALEYSKNAYDDYLESPNSPDAAQILLKIGDFYEQTGAYDKAISLYFQAKEVYENLIIFSDANSLYLSFDGVTSRGSNYYWLNYILDYYYVIDIIGNFYYDHYGEDKALNFYKEVINKSTSIGGDYCTVITIQMLSKIGNLYYNNNEYEKAIEYYIKTKKMLDEPIYKEYCINFLLQLNLNLGNCYKQTLDYDNAIECFLLVKKNHEEREDNKTSIAKMLEEIGYCFLFSERKEHYNEARKNYIDAKILYESFDGHYADVARTILYIGISYHLEGYYDSALHHYLQAQGIFQETGSENSFYGLMLKKMFAYLYYEFEEYPKAYTFFREVIDLEYNIILDEIFTLSESERIEYWDERSELFLSDFPSIALELGEDSATGDLYNMSALFAKGLLLSADNEMRHFIFEGGDSILVSTFKDLQNTRNQINNLNGQDLDKEKGEEDVIIFLKKKTERLEKSIINRLSNMKAFENYKQNFKLSWKQVKDSLKPNDIAIEFLSFPIMGEDNTNMYIALTVRPGQKYNQPHMIKLCEEKALISAKESAYTDTILSNMIWGKLAKELNGVDTIYFSPSGLLHTIAIESMPHWEKPNVLMCDSLKIYRLSSTRELAMKRNPVEDAKGAVLFGAINYDCPITEMEAALNKDPLDDESLAASSKTDEIVKNDFAGSDYLACNDNSNRLSKNFVKGIKGIFDIGDIKEWPSLSPDEVRCVEELLKQKYVSNEPIKLIYGTNATETAFKKLRERKIRIIHIDTHGFYLDESEARQIDHEKTPFMITQSNGDKTEDYDPMTRCALVFAGANHLIKKDFKKESLPAEVDDGYLTAQEVANIDLRGLELLVLSACESALGELDGDGVFGIQRGFKKAGAQTIIMSLWQVDPAATELMMKKFYEAWLGDKDKPGVSKRKAFVIAQNAVKDEYGNKYDYKNEKQKGPHWAAFILLDATEK